MVAVRLRRAARGERTGSCRGTRSARFPTRRPGLLGGTEAPETAPRSAADRGRPAGLGLGIWGRDSARRAFRVGWGLLSGPGRAALRLRRPGRAPPSCAGSSWGECRAARWRDAQPRGERVVQLGSRAAGAAGRSRGGTWTKRWSDAPVPGGTRKESSRESLVIVKATSVYSLVH